jgi:cell division protein FtsQ
MASSSGRRSASSGGSRKRRSVYISSGGQPERGRGSSDAAIPAGGRARATRRGSSQPPALERTAPRPRAGAPAGSRAEATRKTPRGGTGDEAAPPGRAPRSASSVRFAEGKRDERERRLATQRMRVRLVLGGIAAALIVLVIGSVLLYRSAAFSVRHVVVTGNARISTARILALAAIPADATLLRLPSDEIAARVRSDPWIESASVQGAFPDKVTIAVHERVPVALVDLGKARGVWVVDADGSFIASRTPASVAGLPVVRDVVANGSAISMKDPPETMLNALKVLGGLGTQLRSSAKYVTAASIDETAIFTKDGVEILFGAASQMSKKDFLAKRILADQKGKVVFIDVRSVDRPVWRGLGK